MQPYACPKRQTSAIAPNRIAQPRDFVFVMVKPHSLLNMMRRMNPASLHDRDTICIVKLERRVTTVDNNYALITHLLGDIRRMLLRISRTSIRESMCRIDGKMCRVEDTGGVNRKFVLLDAQVTATARKGIGFGGRKCAYARQEGGLRKAKHNSWPHATGYIYVNAHYVTIYCIRTAELDQDTGNFVHRLSRFTHIDLTPRASLLCMPQKSYYSRSNAHFSCQDFGIEKLWQKRK